MATYQSNRSGKSKARAIIGAQYAAATRELKDAKDELEDEYAALWRAGSDLKKEQDAAETDALKNEQDWWWEAGQAILAIGAGVILAPITGGSSLAIALGTYAGLQEIEEGAEEYHDKQQLENIADEYKPQIQKAANQLRDFDFDISDYQRKFSKLYDPSWENVQEERGDAKAREAESWITDFQDQIDDYGTYEQIIFDTITQTITSSAKGYGVGSFVGSPDNYTTVVDLGNPIT